MRGGLFTALLAAALVAGCQPDTRDQQRAALTLSADNLAQRQLTMRRFDTKDDAVILSSAAGVLQDLGFTIEESAAKAGLIVASKDRDATQAGEVAGQIFLAALVAAFGGKADPTWEHSQKIRVSLVTIPSADKNAVIVRATFQRVIWNTKNQISRVETIDDAVIYREFFDKLSQSVFLEAHSV
jgi:hypothetical protein